MIVFIILFILIADLILLFNPNKIIVKERLKSNQAIDEMKKKVRFFASMVLICLLLVIAVFIYIVFIDNTVYPQLYDAYGYVNIK